MSISMSLIPLFLFLNILAFLLPKGQMLMKINFSAPDNVSVSALRQVQLGGRITTHAE